MQQLNRPVDVKTLM